MQLFENFSPQSRVWIYQCNRPFTQQEIAEITSTCKTFTESWTAHENKLKAASAVLYNRFIVFCVDEETSGASGCSIDKSVHLVRDLEKQYHIFLLNRMQVAYLENENVMACPLPIFLNLFSENKVNSSTKIFNNLVTTLSEMNAGWIQPVSESWIQHHLPQTKKVSV
jgi:hypothetical protein